MNSNAPQLKELKPHIIVCGVGGAGGNAVNNMIAAGLSGVDFVVANTDAQALASSRAKRIIQMGLQVTEGLAAGAGPRSARRQPRRRWRKFTITSPVHTWSSSPPAWVGVPAQARPQSSPRAAREMGILTVGVVTKPFHFESGRRMKVAEAGIAEMEKAVDTLIIIPNRTCSASPTREQSSKMLSRWPIRCFARVSPASPT